MLLEDGGHLCRSAETRNALQTGLLVTHADKPDEAETRIPPQRPDLLHHGHVRCPHDQRVEGELALVHPLDGPGREGQPQGRTPVIWAPSSTSRLW